MPDHRLTRTRKAHEGYVYQPPQPRPQPQFNPSELTRIMEDRSNWLLKVLHWNDKIGPEGIPLEWR